MSDDIDINAADQRSHQLRVVTTVCRYTFAALLVAIGSCAYRCNPEAEVAEAQAEQASDYWKGRAHECMGSPLPAVLP